jgi:RNA polymerase sigma-70 factor (ECF subfamily)
LTSSRERFLAFVSRRIAEPEVAEDVLQASFLKAIEAAPRLRDQDRIIPWFYSILRNSIIDAYRRGSVENVHVDLSLAQDVAMDQEEHRILCACFQELIPTLKPEYAELIQVLDLGQESTDSVAARLGISLVNLKVRRHRARQALRSRLEETCRVCAEHRCLDCTCKAEPAAAEGTV